MRRRAKGSGSIFFDARRGRWAAVMPAGYNPATGRRVRLTRHTKTQREAVSALRELAALAERRRPLDAGRAQNMLLPDFVSEYVRLFRSNVRESTLQNYRASLSRIAARIPGLRMKDVTTAALQGFINRSSEAGASRTTIEYDLSMIYGALDVASSDGYIEKVPNRKRLTLPARKEKTRSSMTGEEYAKIRARAAEMLGGLMPLILDIGRYMGMRRGEILGMTWENLDREKGLYSITAQIAGKKQLSPLKTAASRRVVPVPPAILSALTKWRKAQAKTALSNGIGRPELIFCHDDGSPFEPTVISIYFKVAAEACGLSGFTFHGLRHTYASDMAARVDVKTLQGLLGHTSAAMSLDVYAESDAEKIRAAVCPMADS